MKKRKNKKRQNSKILNFDFKNLSNDISEYPYVNSNYGYQWQRNNQIYSRS